MVIIKNKIILLMICSLVISSGFVVTANAASLYVDAHLGDMAPIGESKYQAKVITVTRNANGELISVVTADAVRYLPDPIVDVYLHSDPNYLLKQGKIGDETVRMYQVKAIHQSPQCLDKAEPIPGKTDVCNWYNRAHSTVLQVSDGQGNEWSLFRGLNHGFITKGLDDVTSFWTIITKD